MEQHSGKHFPRPTPETQPYWDGCLQRKLLLQQCGQCATRQFYPRTICSQCMSEDLHWISASGRGTIRSFTVVRRPVSQDYAADTPYIVALVRLEEGPTMMSNILGCDPAEPVVGMAVEVLFEQWSEQLAIPQFRLSNSTA